jgi:DNA-binding transcriptional ArsR family regulator
MRHQPKKPISKLIVKLLPDFCWQTAFEVLVMMEAHMINLAEEQGGTERDVSQATVSVNLKNLADNGLIERKMRRIKGAINRPGVKEVFYYRRSTSTETNPSQTDRQKSETKPQGDRSHKAYPPEPSIQSAFRQDEHRPAVPSHP